MCGSLPARLSLIHSIKARSTQPGSSCVYPGTPGTQVQSFVPFLKTLYVPAGDEGQSRMVALLVTNFGPARSASAITMCGGVAQLVRTPYHAGGCGFESHEHRQFSYGTTTVTKISNRLGLNSRSSDQESVVVVKFRFSRASLYDRGRWERLACRRNLYFRSLLLLPANKASRVFSTE